jgi:hypothetical protein
MRSQAWIFNAAKQTSLLLSDLYAFSSEALVESIASFRSSHEPTNDDSLASH